jgi:hypothetical protein
MPQSAATNTPRAPLNAAKFTAAPQHVAASEGRSNGLHNQLALLDIFSRDFSPDHMRPGKMLRTNGADRSDQLQGRHQRGINHDGCEELRPSSIHSFRIAAPASQDPPSREAAAKG